MHAPFALLVALAVLTPTLAVYGVVCSLVAAVQAVRRRRAAVWLARGGWCGVGSVAADHALDALGRVLP